MSRKPQIQLGLLPGFEIDVSSVHVDAGRQVEDLARKTPRAISAEREGRAAQGALAISVDPTDLEGWREELGHERPRIGPDGACSIVERWRRLEDGTLGPCPFLGCPRHLLLDQGAPITIGGRRRAELLLNRAGLPATMGRRPALAAVPTEGEADAFALEALQRLDELPDTCAVDVMWRLRAGYTAVDVIEAMGGVETEYEEDRAAELAAADLARRHREDALQVQEIARVLGLSVEEVRQDTISGAAKLGIRMVNGQPMPGDGARVDELLAKVDGRRPILTDRELDERAERLLAFLGRPAIPGVDAARTVDRAMHADAAPPPRIRRIERPAPPPPREKSADEIFGEGW